MIWLRAHRLGGKVSNPFFNRTDSKEYLKQGEMTLFRRVLFQQLQDKACFFGDLLSSAFHRFSGEFYAY